MHAEPPCQSRRQMSAAPLTNTPNPNLRLARAALANLCSDDPGEAVSEGINAAHKLVAATFVAGASHSFDRILFIGAPSKAICDFRYRA